MNNQLSADFENRTITYMSGDDEVKLSPAIIKKYLVSGDANNVTEQEIVMFLNLCKFQKLNPFLRDAYLIKFGSMPATLVTGKSAFEKRAARCPQYNGFKAGIIVLTKNEQIIERDGSFYLPSEKIVGGWAEVYIKGFEVPIKSTVSIFEYVGRKKDGSVNGQWTTKPATMIRKVAKAQALREAFPEEFQGLYVEEEMDINTPETVEVEIVQKANTVDFNQAVSENELQTPKNQPKANAQQKFPQISQSENLFNSDEPDF